MSVPTAVQSARTRRKARERAVAGQRPPAGAGGPGLDNAVELLHAAPRQQRWKPTDRRVVDQRQERRWQLLRGLKGITGKKSVKGCCLPVGRGRVGVTVRDGVGHFSGLQSCANVWLCPRCSAKIRAGRTEDVLEAFERHEARGGGFVFLTVTLPHDPTQRLAELLRALSKAWERTTNSRAYKRWRETAGLVGNIGALEVTHGVNGWHPHRHLLLFTDRKLSPDAVEAWEAELHAVYNKQLAKLGFKPSKERVGIRMDYVSKPDKAVARYVSKLQAGFELTRTDLKQSRAADGKGATPFDLLERAIEGDADARRLWGEFEHAISGKSAVRFSKGLRGHLEMEDAKTDEELAEEEVGGEATLYLTGKLYRRIFFDGQAVALLRVAEWGRVDELLSWLRQRYGELDARETEGIGLLVGVE